VRITKLRFCMAHLWWIIVRGLLLCESKWRAGDLLAGGV
jgi:hypothetical protein